MIDEKIKLAFVVNNIRHGAKYGGINTYQELSDSWGDDEQTLPTQNEINAAWANGLMIDFQNETSNREARESRTMTNEIQLLKARVSLLEGQ